MFDPSTFCTSVSPVLLCCLLTELPSTLQVAEKAQLLGSGLLAKGCQPNPEQFVGIFAQNRPEVGLLLWASEGEITCCAQPLVPIVTSFKNSNIACFNQCLPWKCVGLFSYWELGADGECGCLGQLILNHVCSQTQFLIYLPGRQNYFCRSCVN